MPRKKRERDEDSKVQLFSPKPLTRETVRSVPMIQGSGPQSFTSNLAEILPTKNNTSPVLAEHLEGWCCGGPNRFYNVGDTEGNIRTCVTNYPRQELSVAQTAPSSLFKSLRMSGQPRVFQLNHFWSSFHRGIFCPRIRMGFHEPTLFFQSSRRLMPWGHGDSRALVVWGLVRRLYTPYYKVSRFGHQAGRTLLRVMLLRLGGSFNACSVSPPAQELA